MNDLYGNQQTMSQTLIRSKKAANWRARKTGVYQFILFSVDLLAVWGAYVWSHYLLDTHIGLWEAVPEMVCVALLAFVITSFYLAYDLYSFRLIFLKSEHFYNLLKALWWSVLTCGFISWLYQWGAVEKSQLLIPVTVLGALGILLLSRFYWEQIINLLIVAGLGFAVVGLLGNLGYSKEPGVLFKSASIFFILAQAAVLIAVLRLFLVHVVYGQWLRKHFRRRLIIIGTDTEARNVTDHIITYKAPFWVSGYLEVNKCSIKCELPKACLGDIRRLPALADSEKITEIIVTEEEIDKSKLIAILDYCTSAGITVWFPPRLLPILKTKLRTENFCGLPMIRLCAQKNGWLFNKAKHSLEALLVLPLFLLMSPILAVIALAIKINSKGPVFYKARAIGRDGQEFGMYKFRSMVVNNSSDSHKAFVTKLIKGEIGGTGKDSQRPLKITDDPRITSVGKFLRKYSLDELPQLINVVKGDMSLVGPRPCLPYEWELYKNWQKRRSSVRPGISGLWQVAGRSAVGFEDMILLDLYYVYNRTLLMDLNVLFETVFVVLNKKGAY
jgi:undecaprenyl-phosphate galactose phosphotransferase